MNQPIAPITYRVQIPGPRFSYVEIGHSMTREAAINLAGEHFRKGARVFNERTGDEVINSHDGQIREVP